jgi:hypothetical protein
MNPKWFAVPKWQGLGLLAVVAVCSFPAVVRADDVQVTLLVILASEQDSKIDPRLQCVAQQVRKTYPELKGFRVEEILHESIPVGKKKDFELIGDQKATVRVVHGCDEEDRMLLKLKVEGFGEVDYKTCCGKFFPVMTRYRTKDNERLLVAVGVKPCKKAAEKKE